MSKPEFILGGLNELNRKLKYFYIIKLETEIMILLGLLLALLGAHPLHAYYHPVEIQLVPGTKSPVVMNMGQTRDVPITLLYIFSESALKESAAIKTENITVFLKAETVSPQINALNIIDSTRFITTEAKTGLPFLSNAMIRLQAEYIGHAYISVEIVELEGSKRYHKLNVTNSTKNRLDVTIVQYEGIWGKIFLTSVTLFIIISYINLGAQLDSENLKQIRQKPKTIILGFIITVLVMPIISWFASLWLLKDQLLYRAGSFIFACGPAASASTLWTVMLDADKELSTGLQVVSMTGALISMPILLYIMEINLQIGPIEQIHRIQVPYARLIQTLVALIFALFVGWRFVGRNKRLKQISAKIFRPLTFFVLIFIIVFSSIIYWYIYRMFDWTITLTSFIITMSTYLITGLVGYLINRNMDDAIVVSISSTYKNSGIAFAVLLVAFETPDTYIAYVPCLTQIVTTSLSLYLFYSILKLINYLKRRKQPAPIQATTEVDEEVDPGSSKKEARSGSNGDKSTKSEENADEFIVMNVTDIVPESPLSRKADDIESAEERQD